MRNCVSLSLSLSPTFVILSPSDLRLILENLNQFKAFANKQSGVLASMCQQCFQANLTSLEVIDVGKVVSSCLLFLACPHNTYKVTRGDEKCRECPENSRSPGSAAKCECEAGYFRPHNSTGHEPCTKPPPEAR